MRVLLITGAAPCLAEDIASFLEQFPNSKFDVLAIGIDAIRNHTLPIQYVATYHPDDLLNIRKAINETRPGAKYKTICHKNWDERKQEPIPGVDMVIPYKPPSGSSALLGVLWGIKYGYKKIVLCGCPLTGVNSKNANYETFRRGWETTDIRPLVENRVRAVSGWIAERFGKPSMEWLLEE